MTRERNPGKLPTRGIKQRASKRFGKRVEYPDPHAPDGVTDDDGNPVTNPTTTGIVVGYDPQPLGRQEGHWLLVSRDDDNQAVDFVEFGTETVID